MVEKHRDKLHIRLHVYDTTMNVTIPRDEEEYYRSAAELITEIISTYSSLYKGKRSDKDIMYMALIDIALRLKKESARNDITPYNNILNQLTSEIEQALAE